MHIQYSYKHSFFFNDTATTEIYTLSLHDALPISWVRACAYFVRQSSISARRSSGLSGRPMNHPQAAATIAIARSEEHTSELQSRLHLVCRILLEKKIIVLV